MDRDCVLIDSRVMAESLQQTIGGRPSIAHRSPIQDRHSENLSLASASRGLSVNQRSASGTSTGLIRGPARLRAPTS